ncbi:MAG: hypothetical protein H8E26_06995 [FCB group bacterium]|nr:hypothetical protein [FCB group bacterium]MBL7027128.1 hypothetical protein [Candidatus Neomarinimicrobiota bacterium]MBL7120637.1 hypothetical protein [Candidatus Neomarinimicrobiota bacterium]
MKGRTKKAYASPTRDQDSFMAYSIKVNTLIATDCNLVRQCESGANQFT